MKSLLLFFLAAGLSAFAKEERGFKYPEAHKLDQLDDYHGTKVTDPY